MRLGTPSAGCAKRRAACSANHNLYVNGKVWHTWRVTIARPARPSQPTDRPSTSKPERLLRIQEVASELGLTARSIRYYEELGLLNPAARSEGAYRLYDASDVDRLGGD